MQLAGVGVFQEARQIQVGSAEFRAVGATCEIRHLAAGLLCLGGIGGGYGNADDNGKQLVWPFGRHAFWCNEGQLFTGVKHFIRGVCD